MGTPNATAPCARSVQPDPLAAPLLGLPPPLPPGGCLQVQVAVRRTVCSPTLTTAGVSLSVLRVLRTRRSAPMAWSLTKSPTTVIGLQPQTVVVDPTRDPGSRPY